MIEPYAVVKWAHIVSAILLFGTGLGTAFHMWMSHRSGDVRAIAQAARNTVLADWLFTVPSGIVQPVTGIAMILMAGYDPHAPWLMAAYVLYALAGVCWLRVAVLQIRVRDLAGAAAGVDKPLPAAYFAAMRQWFWLGWPAFIGLALTVGLMVAKPEF